ncbi:MAG TPA: hypothetical protein VLJ83_03550 [Gemmatimonadaceae bacterium]|nr:hypothetical protein [Gemmatimonadaceae bacterium]
MLRLTPIMVASMLLPAAPAAAQVSTNARVSNLAANAAIGGVLAAARSLFGTHQFARSLALGTLGGAIQGAGRQVAAGRSTASGIVGRQLSALGISLGYSAGADSLVLIAPVWLVTFEVRPHLPNHVRARVNLMDFAFVTSALIDGRSLDVASSLSAGAPVFTRALTPKDKELGYTRMGVIFLTDGIPSALRREALSHESVHLLQWDAYNQLVAFPVERKLVRSVRGGTSLSRFLDLGVLSPTSALLIAERIRYERQPWEREAYLLTTGRPTNGPH